MQNKSYLLTLFLLILVCFESSAQLTTPYPSPKAKVMQRVGITDVTIVYYRPSVNGREIWGKVVPYGYNNFGFGTSTAAPWRAGANDNTIIKFSNDVTIAGKSLKAGVYGLHMALEESGKVTVIFSNNSSSWGSFFYDEKEDALRIETQWEDAPMQEMLAFEFTEVKQNSAIASLRWDKKRIPFQIEVDVHKQVIANFKEELRSNKGFNWAAWNTAATYCLNNDVDLEQGLTWADAAISAPFIGQKNFTTLSTKAQLLNKLKRTEDAQKVMDEALPLGSALQVHGYARQLITVGNKDKALEVFKWNAKNNPDTWPVDLGLARGYSAKGEYKKALQHAQIALTRVPEGDNLNKSSVENAIELLKSGKDIN